MKAAAVCCALSLAIVLFAVVEGRPGQSRWRRAVTNTTSTTSDTTTETINGPASNGTCPTVPYCDVCDHNNAECVYCPNGTVYSSDYKSCLSCGSNCLKCHISGTGTDGLDTTVCDECEVSYALDSKNECQYCGSVLCLTCNISTDADGKVITKHLTCVEKAHLVNDVCEGCPDYCDTCTVVANADGTLTKTCSKCISGYGFQGGSTCSKCPSNCLTCEKEKDKCDSQGCIDGYARVESSGVCEACGQYCYKCQASAGPGKCDSGNCYTNVTELYVNVPHLYPVIYVSSTQTCEKCSEYCTSCSAGAQCDVCVEGYYANDLKTCTRCISNCQSCTSGTDCTKCYDGYVKRTSSTGTVSCEACPRKCSQCADTPHPVKTTELLCEVCSPRNQLTSVNTCDACPQNCLVCTWDGTCTSCEAGYVIYNGECTKCPDYCTACTVSSDGVPACIAGKCTSTETGQGRVVYNGQCELCPDYCTECTVTSTGTKECLYSACQSNSVWIPGEKICKQCPANCGGWCSVSPITGDSFCEECALGYARNDAGTCEACPANCDRCFWDGSTTLCYLSGCNSKYYQQLLSAAKLTNTQLSTTCSANTDQNCLIASPVPFFDSTAGLCEMCQSGYVNTTEQCKSCTSNCLTCEASGNSAVCKACATDSVTITDSTSGLITQCKACSSIASACQSCTTDTCTTCNAGYLLHNEATCVACSDQADSVCAISSNVLSTTSCPSGYTETNDGCQKCPDGCSVCTYSTSTGLTTCSSCFSGYYHGSDDTCTVCSPTANCATCTTAVDQCATCKAKYYMDGTTCKPCMSNCDSCSSATTCSSCAAGTSYHKNDQNEYSCVRCSVSNCLACSTGSETADATQCSACEDGYTVSAGLCLKCPDGCTKCTAQNGQAVCDYGHCAMGYVMVAKTGDTVACESCGTGCATCHVEQSGNKACDACLIDDVGGTSYYLSSSGVCEKISNCRYVNSTNKCDHNGCATGKVRKGSFPDATCEDCPTGCDKCYFEDTAQTVKKCYSGQCSAGYAYYDGGCYACPANCATCSKNATTTYCTQCSEGYAVNNTDIGCTACASGCAACSNADVVGESCTRCQNNYVLVSGTCQACADHCVTCSVENACDIGGCASGYGRMEYTTTNITCESCPQNCLKCDGDPSVCMSGQCEVGYFRASDQLCYKCADNCVTCSAENQCDTAGCQAFYGRIAQNDGNITCDSCPANCSRCDGDASICEPDQCDVGYVRGSDQLCHKIDCGGNGEVLKSDGTCQAPISNCNVGVVSGSTCPQGACQLGYIWNNGACVQCPANCMNCKLRYDGSTAVCHNNGCKRGFGVKPDGTCMACPNQCDECEYNGIKMVCTVCHERNYGLVEANTCLRCPSGCTACTELNQVLQCTACAEGYVLNPTLKLCVRCTSNCKVCTFNEVTLSTQCTVCNSKYKLTATGCTRCSDGCLKCDQTTDSSSCDPLYCETGFVQGPTGACHQCPSECPDRCKYNETTTTGVNVACFPTREFYWDGGTTLRRCSDAGDGSCVECKDSVTCYQTGCKEGYTWNQFKCEKKHTDIGTGNAFCVGYVCPECLDGYYMTTLDADPNQRTCKACADDDPNCAQCVDDSGKSRCTVCKSSYYLDLSYKCIACPVDKNCKECQLVGTDVKCTSCPANYYLYATTGTCIECFPSPCSECDATKDSDAKVCTACADGYFLNSTTHTCNACNTTCATCTDGSKCVTCKTGYLLDSSTKYCFKCPDSNAYNCELKNGYDSLILTDGCVSGYAVSTDKKSCLKCPDYCTKCDSNLTCSTCETGYSLNSDQCGRCPLNCKSCTAKKDSDKRLKLSCDVCDDGYALYSDGLCYVCPANCVNCTASDSGTATPKITCTKCVSNLYGIKDGACETCDKLTIENCYTCEPLSMSDNSTTSMTSYTCHSCKGNNVLSLDNQTCLSCDSVNCGTGGICGAHSLCTTCQNSFTNVGKRNCTVKCYKCDKGQSCKHIDDKWKDLSGMSTVECDGPCFFYTQYPLNGGKDSRVSWYGCADPKYTVLNYEATYNDKMKALECKGKEGQPETCVYTCAYDGCNPGDTASAVVPLVSLLIMALLTSLFIQQN